MRTCCGWVFNHSRASGKSGAGKNGLAAGAGGVIVESAMKTLSAKAKISGLTLIDSNWLTIGRWCKNKPEEK
jgi:hypothetical protein